MLSLYATLFFLLNNLVLYSQEQESIALSGVVVEASSKEPIPFASVWLYGRGGRVQSAIPADSLGRFSLQNLKRGSYKIAASFMRYMSDTIDIHYSGSPIDVGEMAISGGLELMGATVIDSMAIIRHYPDRLIYDVSMDPEARRVKMMDIMTKIPSMEVKPIDGKLSYMNADVSTILIDGERHDMINASFQFPMGLIRGDVMSKIEVIPPNSPQYNNPKPLINIITSRRLPNGYAAEVTLSANNKWSAGGGVSLVTKFLKDYIVSVKYSPNFSSSPKLEYYLFRESLHREDITLTTEQNKITWSDSQSHSLSLRSSAKLFGNKLSFGVATIVAQSNTYSITENEVINLVENSIEQQKLDITNQFKTPPRLIADVSYSHPLPFAKYRANYTYTYTDQLTNSNYWAKRVNTPLDDRASESSTGSKEHAANLLIMKSGFRRHMLRGSLSFVGRQYQNSSDYQVYDYTEGGYIDVPEMSYGLEYIQKVASANVSYVYTSKKIIVQSQATLQWERDNGVFKSTGDTPLDYENIRLNIGGSVRYNIVKLFSLGVGYHQRVVRPDVSRLNPYIDDSDPMNLRRGNPELKPELAHDVTFSLQIGRQPITKGVIFLRSLYSHINNAIEEVVTIDNEGVSTSSFYNLGKMRSVSAELLHAQPRIFSWLNFDHTGRYSLYLFESGNPDIGSLRNSSFEYSAGFAAMLSKASTFGMRYNLRSSDGGAQSIKTNIYHFLSLSYSRNLIKNRLYGSISINDPFLKRRFIERTIGSEIFRQETRREQRGSIVGISLRLNFGRFKDRIADRDIDIAGDRSRSTVGSGAF